jgi:hypothetical protein
LGVGGEKLSSGKVSLATKHRRPYAMSDPAGGRAQRRRRPPRGQLLCRRPPPRAVFFGDFFCLYKKSYSP